MENEIVSMRPAQLTPENIDSHGGDVEAAAGFNEAGAINAENIWTV